MSFLHKTLNFILPPRCIVTGEIVDSVGILSPEAWAALSFIGDPHCVRCGFPFEFMSEPDFEANKDNLCGGCVKKPPIYTQARSALVYDDASRDLILGFKHGDQIHNVLCFVPWLERIGSEILKDADFLVPVPLHPWRLIRRRFNQSAIIAKALNQETEIPFILNALRRVRHTPTQGRLRQKERQKNVKNAFDVPTKVRETLRGKHVVLIDDVLTSGATIQECTKALLKNGVGKVSVLTLARVVKPS